MTISSSYPHVTIVVDHSEESMQLFLIKRQCKLLQGLDLLGKWLNTSSGYPISYILDLGFCKM